MSRRLNRYIVAGIFIAMLFVLSSSAFACTTVIVGKKVSETEEVIVGHNEDNGGRLVMTEHLVPEMTHSKGELIQLEPSRARIPQVEKTFSYLWFETRAPRPGASFSDFYVNQWGVVITSDSCWPSREVLPDLTDGGVGYGLRRVMAERARSAREAVEIATTLLDKYGYCSSGRSYQVADAEEAWVLQVVNGKNYVAQRVPDDEIVVIPNHYVIRDIDFDDDENFIVSPNLVSHAIENGWYKPAAESYSDFDFAKAYQRPDRFKVNYNVLRQIHAMEILSEKTIKEDTDLSFSFSSGRKIAVQDVMKVLRSHYEGTDDGLAGDVRTSPHFTPDRTLCTATTRESIVVQIRENPDLSVIWRSSGRPCLSPYVPWYGGISRIPDGYSWIEPEIALANHFSAPADDYGYDAKRAWWAFMDLQNIIDPFYGDYKDEIRNSVEELESRWFREQKEVEDRIKSAFSASREEGRRAMTSYTCQQAAAAVDMARSLFRKLNFHSIEICSDEVDLNRPEKELVVLIKSDKSLKAENLDPDSILFGAACNNPLENWAMTEDYSLRDIDGDGDLDGVATFITGDFTAGGTPCLMDLWLTAENDKGEIFVARDLVRYVRK